MFIEKYKEQMEYIEKECSILANIAKKHDKKTVVDAGLLKAGKSSLFNALAEKNIFEADVVRATIKNQQVELDEYILLDTPGLNAREDDTNIALDGYENADVILFVHDLQEGEFTQTEINSVLQIANIFGDINVFFKNAILVLTHADRVEEHCDAICNQIEKQFQEIFHDYFTKVFCVDSTGYMKGLQENKKLLIQESGIPELRAAIMTYIRDDCDLQRSRLENNKKACFNEIDKIVTMIRAEIPSVEPNRIEKLKRLQQEIEKKSSEAVTKISKRCVELRHFSERDFHWLVIEKDYKEYSSKSLARSAGIEAIQKMIGKAQREGKSDGLSMVENAERYVIASGVPQEIKDFFSDEYEMIRKKAKECNVLIKHNFNLVIKSDGTEDAKRELSYVRNRVRDCGSSLRTASSYADADYYNLDIDCDYTSKWVKTLFGEKYKKVWVYSYDAKSPMEEVCSDLADYLDDRRDDAQSAVSPAFEEIKKDLCAQFKTLTTAILKEIDGVLGEETAKQAQVRDEIQQAEKMIAILQDYKNRIEVL